MQLRSGDFAAHGKIPRTLTCDGENLSPALQWSDAPAQTLSFVILCNDPDAPGGVFRHWAAYDIPGSWTMLPRGAGSGGQSHPFRQAVNDFGRTGYGGPCPPTGHGSHHYQFRLIALSVKHLPVAGGAHCRDVEREARKTAIGEAVLTGIYER